MAETVDAEPTLDPDTVLDRWPSDLWDALVFQVVGQQLSVAATQAVLARLEALHDGRLATPTEMLFRRTAASLEVGSRAFHRVQSRRSPCPEKALKVFIVAYLFRMMGDVLYANLFNATMNAFVLDTPVAVDHINRAVSELEAERRIVRCVKTIDGRAPRLHFSLA